MDLFSDLHFLKRCSVVSHCLSYCAWVNLVQPYGPHLSKLTITRHLRTLSFSSEVFQPTVRQQVTVNKKNYKDDKILGQKSGWSESRDKYRFLCQVAGSGIPTNKRRTVTMSLLMSKAGTGYCYAGTEVQSWKLPAIFVRNESGSTQCPGLNTGLLLLKDTTVMTYNPR